jgi:hypothetical protein
MFPPFMVRYDAKFEGWPAKGSIAALSHPSEGWREKGHMSCQYPDALSVMDLLEPCSSPGRFTVHEFFFRKKAMSPWGQSNDPRNSLNQPLGNFEAGH